MMIPSLDRTTIDLKKFFFHYTIHHCSIKTWYHHYKVLMKVHKTETFNIDFPSQ